MPVDCLSVQCRRKLSFLKVSVAQRDESPHFPAHYESPSINSSLYPRPGDGPSLLVSFLNHFWARSHRQRVPQLEVQNHVRTPLERTKRRTRRICKKSRPAAVTARSWLKSARRWLAQASL